MLNSCEWSLISCDLGFRLCGKDCPAISSILGTKTADHVETFFNIYRLKYQLDSLCQEGGTDRAIVSSEPDNDGDDLCNDIPKDCLHTIT